MLQCCDKIVLDISCQIFPSTIVHVSTLKTVVFLAGSSLMYIHLEQKIRKIPPGICRLPNQKLFSGVHKVRNIKCRNHRTDLLTNSV